MKRTYLSILALLLASVLVQAQVTIGSGEKPISGALLQLKNITDINDGASNATQGLGMPRIHLTNKNDITADIAGVDNTNKNDHVGLVIYNTNFCLTGEGSEDGLYVWDGSEWIHLPPVTSESRESFDPITGILTDFDGNRYPTKVYGTAPNKVRWMTRNLRALRKPDGKLIDCENGLRLNPPYHNSAGKAIKIRDESDFEGVVLPSYSINPIEMLPTVDRYATYFGLMYQRAQGMIACPTGWRLPSDDEWNLLTSAVTGQPDVNIAILTAGARMKNTDVGFFSADGPIFLWNYYPYPPIPPSGDSGFDAVPAGHVAADGTRSTLWGSRANWWSNNSAGGNLNYSVNGIDHNYPANNPLSLASMGGDPNYYLSIRCVKTEP